MLDANSVPISVEILFTRTKSLHSSIVYLVYKVYIIGYLFK